MPSKSDDVVVELEGMVELEPPTSRLILWG